MKKFVLILIVTLFSIFSMIGIASASPLYYTFEGNVLLLNDAAGIANLYNLKVGDQVSYTFLVDFQAAGTYTTFAGQTIVRNESGIDFFYADYISGSGLPYINGGFWHQPGHGSAAAEINYGYDNPNNLYQAFTGMMEGKSADDRVYVGSDTVIASQWTIGTQVEGSNMATSNDGSSTDVFSLLTLVSIDSQIPSVPNPVPEPTSIVFLGLGLVGIAGIRRKMQ